jgi:ATP-binding cassette subfamily B protein
LIIAHRPATIALADRVVLIGDGRVVATGTHEELLATSDEYRTVLASAALAVADPSGPDDAPLLAPEASP